MSTDKNAIRTEMRKKRAEIVFRERKNRAITESLLTFLREREFSRIFIYLSKGSEVETHSLVRELLTERKQVCVPYTNGGTMSVKALAFLPEVVCVDKFGNLQDAFLLQDADKPCDCAIVPMLAYNEELFRLGYGGGYYDRYLSRFSGCKIGVAFREQFCSRFVPEAHDIPMDKIITEDGILVRKENIWL